MGQPTATNLWAGSSSRSRPSPYDRYNRTCLPEFSTLGQRDRMERLFQSRFPGGCQMSSDADPTALYEAKSFRSTSGGPSLEMPYRLLRPRPIETGRRYPLVLFLHGAGERGSDNREQLIYLPTWLASAENRRQYPAFVVAPQCPTGMQWSNIAWSNRQSEPLAGMSRPMQAVVGLLDELVASEPIDERRIYLTGLSMGGYGSWDLASGCPSGLRRWCRFAAAATRVMPIGWSACRSGPGMAIATRRCRSSARGG